MNGMRYGRLTLISIVWLLGACTGSSSTDTHSANTATDSIVSDTSDVAQEAIQLAQLRHEADNSPADDTTTSVAFVHFSVLINRLATEVSAELTNPGADTLELDADLGETIEGQLITISTSRLTGVTVEQRYETSVTIMNEGPHCDLTEWKHYQSPWRSLTKNRTGQFVGLTYSERDRELFPEVSMQALRTAVATYCDESYVSLVKPAKSTVDYPSAVSISRYFIRINGRRKDNGQMIRKVLVINNAMGC